MIKIDNVDMLELNEFEAALKKNCPTKHKIIESEVLPYVKSHYLKFNKWTRDKGVIMLFSPELLENYTRAINSKPAGQSVYEFLRLESLTKKKLIKDKEAEAV